MSMEMDIPNSQHLVLSWFVDYAAKHGIYQIIEACEKLMDTTLSDPKIIQRLQISMFQRVLKDKSFIQNYIFTDAAEMYEKAVPDNAPRNLGSPYFSLLIEMKMQALLPLEDDMKLFKRKVEQLFDPSGERDSEKRQVLEDTVKELLRYHHRKLDGKEPGKQFVKNHSWMGFYQAMNKYMRALSDKIGSSHLETVENEDAFASKRPCRRVADISKKVGGKRSTSTSIPTVMEKQRKKAPVAEESEEKGGKDNDIEREEHTDGRRVGRRGKQTTKDYDFDFTKDQSLLRRRRALRNKERDMEIEAEGEDASSEEEDTLQYLRTARSSSSKSSNRHAGGASGLQRRRRDKSAYLNMATKILQQQQQLQKNNAVSSSSSSSKSRTSRKNAGGDHKHQRLATRTDEARSRRVMRKRKKTKTAPQRGRATGRPASNSNHDSDEGEQIEVEEEEKEEESDAAASHKSSSEEDTTKYVIVETSTRRTRSSRRKAQRHDDEEKEEEEEEEEEDIEEFDQDDGNDEEEENQQPKGQRNTVAALELKRKSKQFKSRVVDPLPSILKKSKMARRLSSGAAATVPGAGVESRSKYDFEHPDAKEVSWEEADKYDEGLLASPKARNHGALVRRRSSSRAGQKRSAGGQGKKKRRRWSEKEEADLREGFDLYGEMPNKWARIKAKFSFPGRRTVDLKDKWRNMRNKAAAASR
eukprot:jgi/Bigna1/88367/estExt_fgenesh1_pg.C_310073